MGYKSVTRCSLFLSAHRLCARPNTHLKSRPQVCSFLCAGHHSPRTTHTAHVRERSFLREEIACSSCRAQRETHVQNRTRHRQPFALSISVNLPGKPALPCCAVACHHPGTSHITVLPALREFASTYSVRDTAEHCAKYPCFAVTLVVCKQRTCAGTLIKGAYVEV
jgi:hypothetical protein